MRDNTGVTGLVINNGSVTNSAAPMQTADADVVQMNKAKASVILNNYGSMISLTASAGGSQAVDFNAVTADSDPTDVLRPRLSTSVCTRRLCASYCVSVTFATSA